LHFSATVETVHLSCADLEDCLTEEQTEQLFDAVGGLQNLQELFVFRGNCAFPVENLLSKCLQKAVKIKVLMLWDFGAIGDNPVLAGAIRSHPALERVTLTLPGGLPYAYLDVYVMGFASMKSLRCLSIRCQSHQEEAAISPEALSILATSKAIRSLYLLELGLIDDHSDALALELQDNETLELLDVKDNFFSDDALYTFAVTLKKNKTLTSLDLTGTTISPDGGQALADALLENHTITNLELDGGAERFADEFDIPVGHRDEPWMQALDKQLRLNRAHQGVSLKDRRLFVEALNSVSDHLGCLYHFIRNYPAHCEEMSMPKPFRPAGVGGDVGF
jgi:hypothetical protein